MEVKRASEHIEKLAERARVAESAQKEAHSQLKSAGLEASTARKLVEAVSMLLIHWGSTRCHKTSSAACACNSHVCLCSTLYLCTKPITSCFGNNMLFMSLQPLRLFMD